MVINGPIAIDSLPSIPWKNGDGTTRTLAVEPANAGLDDFVWRISMAEIREPGSFSAFPGIERTILLWRGDGVTLRSPAWPQHTLTEAWMPFSFRGEDEVTCSLTGESTVDLNLMVRRGAALGTIQTANREVVIDYPCDDVVVLCAAGNIDVGFADRAKFSLKTDEFLCISQVDAEVVIIPEKATATFVYALVHRLR